MFEYSFFQELKDLLAFVGKPLPKKPDAKMKRKPAKRIKVNKPKRNYKDH